MTTIASVRLTSAQIFMRTFKENAEQTQTGSGGAGNGLASTLLQQYDIDTSEDRYDNGLYSLLDSLGGQDASGAGTVAAQEISGDIGSASFMAGLRQTLESLKATADGKAKAEAMLKALEDRTLTVTDAADARQIKAWDVKAEAEKDTKSKATTTVPAQNWSEFLKSRLMRERNGTYAHADNGSYIDRTTGESSHFGTVGDTYVYLSWPSAATGS